MTGLKIMEAIATVRAAAAEGLLTAAKHIETVSTAHAPYEHGDLGDSAKVTEDVPSLTAAISYDTPYAVRQHEQMNLHHDAGRTAKFLEHAMTSEASAAAQIIADAVRSKLGGVT